MTYEAQDDFLFTSCYFFVCVSDYSRLLPYCFLTLFTNLFTILPTPILLRCRLFTFIFPTAWNILSPKYLMTLFLISFRFLLECYFFWKVFPGYPVLSILLKTAYITRIHSLYFVFFFYYLGFLMLFFSSRNYTPHIPVILFA